MIMVCALMSGIMCVATKVARLSRVWLRRNEVSELRRQLWTASETSGWKPRSATGVTLQPSRLPRPKTSNRLPRGSCVRLRRVWCHWWAQGRWDPGLWKPDAEDVTVPDLERGGWGGVAVGTECTL